MGNTHLVLLLFFISGSVFSAVPLNGEYQLGGALSHKGEPKKGKSHLYITITDDSAKKLYHSLEGKPEKDMCTDYYVKSQGGLVCYEVTPKEKYFCGFSINTKNNKIEAGLGGCI